DGAEGDRAPGAHRPGVPGRAGHRALLLIEDEVIEGEPAGHRRAQRHGLDDGGVPGRLVVRAGLARAVVRVAVDLQTPARRSAACSSRCGAPSPVSPASTATASFTRSLTRACFAAGSSQSMTGLPGRE